MNYCTKWIEAEHVATITEQKAIYFLWKDVTIGYGRPRSIIVDNGRQFIINKIIHALRKKVEGAKSAWVDEILGILLVLKDNY